MAQVRRTGGGTEKLETIISGISDYQSKVGWFENNRYKENGLPIAYIASIQEFGSPQNQIPPRSFMRKTISEKTAEWKNLSKYFAKQIIKGEKTVESAIDVLGLTASGDIRYTISNLWEPKLKDATIKARLRQMADKKTVGNLYKPLVFTGQLLAGLNNITEKK